MQRKSGGAVVQNGKTPAVVAAPTPAAQRKMLLSAVSDAKVGGGEKIVLYGPEGIGKTWWANMAPKAVFISTESGMKGVKPAPQAFPEPESWRDLFDAVEELRTQEHSYETLVLDTVDWTEALCHRFLMNRDGKSSIDDFGYGKGYVMAVEEWRKLLAPLDRLRIEKGMNIIMLAHSAVVTFNNPAGDNYDRFQMKVDKRVYAILKEWADAVLFASYDIVVDKANAKDRKGKGLGGEKVVYTTHTPAWDAKNRYSMPPEIPMDAAEFWKYVKGEIK